MSRRKLSEEEKLSCSMCGKPATVFTHWKNGQIQTHRCIVCHRISQMRSSARTARKYVPTAEEIMGLIRTQTFAGALRCGNPSCGIELVWTKAEDTKRVATLQHDNPGIRIFCASCNVKDGRIRRSIGTRGGSHISNTCPQCGKSMTPEEYGFKTYCKVCSSKYIRRYKRLRYMFQELSSDLDLDEVRKWLIIRELMAEMGLPEPFRILTNPSCNPIHVGRPRSLW